MNISLAALSGLLEEDFEAFSSAQLLPFFPEITSIDFQIKNKREGELLLSIISPDPFTILDESPDRIQIPRRKMLENITPLVAVFEDEDIDSETVELTAQYPSIDSVLEFVQPKSNN
jgi:hypothetical protein